MLIEFLSSKKFLSLIWLLALFCAIFFGVLFATPAPSGMSSLDWHSVHFFFFFVSLFGVASIGRPLVIESSQGERIKFDLGMDD